MRTVLLYEGVSGEVEMEPDELLWRYWEYWLFADLSVSAFIMADN